VKNDKPEAHDAWARLRFSVVGSLLAAPPPKGKLAEELAKLAAKSWCHPICGEPTTFALSTIERWYYAARNERRDPVGVLRQRVRKDAGRTKKLSAALRTALRAQYEKYPGWSYQLHADNLVALAKMHPELGSVPSYATVKRYMKSQGMFRKKRLTSRTTAGAEAAEARLAELEVRSYEAEYVHGLWHADFHDGSRRVLTSDGEWATPCLFAALDDRSRLIGHAQWYLVESAQTLVHGLMQAIQKRGLPRALMTDNGGAMTAAEVEEGLARLGIIHNPTLPYSPYQNAKLEAFWGPLEGRLIAMLKGVEDLRLEFLNEATQAYIEMEYNRKVHDEIGVAPLSRYLADKNVGRESPDTLTLRRAFRITTTRTQRRSDGTILIEAKRFEIPNRFRHLERLSVRYARWDLSLVDLVDPRSGAILAALSPLDKARNADGARRALEPVASAPAPTGEVAPLLKTLMDEYRATGLPPAYLPLKEKNS
jgi:transposase InsO family protein